MLDRVAQMASLGNLTKQHTQWFTVYPRTGQPMSKQYTHNAILRMAAHKAARGLRLKSPIKAWLDNLGLSEDYSGKFMEIGVGYDTATLKPLTFSIFTPWKSAMEDIEKTCPGMTTFWRTSVNMMSQIDPLLRETLQRDILPNVDSSSILPDPVLMYIFTIMQREYSGRRRLGSFRGHENMWPLETDYRDPCDKPLSPQWRSISLPFTVN